MLIISRVAVPPVLPNGGLLNQNDSEFDGSESGRSRSPRLSRAETGSTALSTPGSMQSQQSRGFTPAPSVSTSTSGGKSTAGEGATIATVTIAGAAALAIGDGRENRLPPRLGRIRLGSSALPPATPGSSGDTVIGAYAALSTPRAGGGACDSGGQEKVGGSPGESGPKRDERATRDTEERAAEAAARARLAWVYEVRSYDEWIEGLVQGVLWVWSGIDGMFRAGMWLVHMPRTWSENGMSSNC